MEPIIELLNSTKEWFDPSLEGIFDDNNKDFITAKAAMYSLTSGGKRVRPCFMYVVGRMLGADMEDVKVFARSLRYSILLSLICIRTSFTLYRLIIAHFKADCLCCAKIV